MTAFWVSIVVALNPLTIALGYRRRSKATNQPALALLLACGGFGDRCQPTASVPRACKKFTSTCSVQPKGRTVDITNWRDWEASSGHGRRDP